MIRRLKIKFVCINMFLVTVMLLVIFGMVLHVTMENMEKQNQQMIQRIQEDHIPPKPRDDGPEPRLPHFVVNIDCRGEMTVSSQFFFETADTQSLLELGREVSAATERTGLLKDQNLRFTRFETPEGEKIVFVDITVERIMMENLVKNCLLIGVISFLLFLGVSILLAQWAIRPVEISWENQRRFVADASHELKTPLTVIMTNAELIQEQSYDAPAREQFLSSILLMSRQMRGLVEGLLELARVDNGILKTGFSRVDLSLAVNDCIMSFEPLFFEKGLELQSETEEGLFVQGSETHLRQMTDILLDNAVKYGDCSQSAVVNLRRQGRNALLCVSTGGEEISRQDLKNIFKRFYRIDRARTMNQSYGLGLSIAWNVVTEHGGRIWAESRNGTNSFYVQLPLTFQNPEQTGITRHSGRMASKADQ